MTIFLQYDFRCWKYCFYLDHVDGNRNTRGIFNDRFKFEIIQSVRFFIYLFLSCSYKKILDLKSSLVGKPTTQDPRFLVHANAISA